MTRRYEFREGTRLPKAVDPNKVGPVLDQLEQKQALTAENVVKEASDPKSPMHLAFTWDDTAAARAHRLDQARYLIGSIRVVVKMTPHQPKNETIKGFVHVPPKNHKYGSSGTYASPATLIKDSDKFARALDSAQHRLNGAQLAVRELLSISSKAVRPVVAAADDHITKAHEELNRLR
jgi:hypothetical protein